MTADARKKPISDERITELQTHWGNSFVPQSQVEEAAQSTIIGLLDEIKTLKATK